MPAQVDEGVATLIAGITGALILFLTSVLSIIAAVWIGWRSHRAQEAQHRSDEGLKLWSLLEEQADALTEVRSALVTCEALHIEEARRILSCEQQIGRLQTEAEVRNFEVQSLRLQIRELQRNEGGTP